MKRFVPLSLVFFLAATTGGAKAGTSLDPYSYIKAPAGTAPAKKKVAPAAAAPQAEDETELKQYVTVKFADKDAEEMKKKGLIGKMMPGKMPGVGSITAPFAKIGGGIANGAKASGNFAKKGATVVGTGFKSTGDKLKDSTHAVTKVAHKQDKKQTANQASLEDIYIREAKRNIAQADPKKAQTIVKKGSNLESSQEAFLPPAKSGGMKLGMLNPFNLAKGKKAPPPRPASGFLDGALNKGGEVDVANKPGKEAKKQIAAKPAAAAADKNAIDQAAGVPENEKIVQEPTAKADVKTKKSKFPTLHVAKFKPSMPSLPHLRKGKKDKTQTNSLMANEPKSGFTAAAQEKKSEEMGLEPVASGKAAPADDFDSSIASFPTGDKEIDSAKPKGSATAGGAIASKPAKKSRLGGLTGMTSAMKFPKLSLRKKPATKAPVPERQTAQTENALPQ